MKNRSGFQRAARLFCSVESAAKSTVAPKQTAATNVIDLFIRGQTILSAAARIVKIGDSKRDIWVCKELAWRLARENTKLVVEVSLVEISTRDRNVRQRLTTTTP